MKAPKCQCGNYPHSKECKRRLFLVGEEAKRRMLERVRKIAEQVKKDYA